MADLTWIDAPYDAMYCTGEGFYKVEKDHLMHFNAANEWVPSVYTFDQLKTQPGFRKRPTKGASRIDVIGQNGNTGEHYGALKPTYHRDIIGMDGTKTTVDVYRVLDAFKTESPALDHAVKKILCPGIRHQKTREQDLREAIKSIEAELLLMSQR